MPAITSRKHRPMPTTFLRCSLSKSTSCFAAAGVRADTSPAAGRSGLARPLPCKYETWMTHQPLRLCRLRGIGTTVGG